MIRRRYLRNRARGNIVYPGLIAAWSAKGKTNDDTDRATLKDLTGNGHDITLNGFAFSGMSGYDGYSENFDTWQKNTDPNTIFQNTSNTVHITKFATTASATVYKRNLAANNLKVRVTGLKESQNIVLGDDILDRIYQKFDTDGDYIIPPFTSKGNCSFRSYNIVGECDITIELLSEYPDALVFDGVDDYGINENMPILTDYTIIAKRKTNDGLGALLSKAENTANAFVFEGGSRFIHNTFSFGFGIKVDIINSDISYQSKNKYNGITIGVGSAIDTNKILLGKFRFWQGVFYSVYLFDRSLDEQEIKAFIRKYIDANYVLPSEQTT
jgi:hypothetical protein